MNTEASLNRVIDVPTLWQILRIAPFGEVSPPQFNELRYFVLFLNDIHNHFAVWIHFILV